MRTERHAIGLALVLALAASTTVYAQPREHREERHFRGDERRWHGDIHRFHERDFYRWRGGRWYHGHHAGRPGWWWIVGGVYYWYPGPVYPYPDPYTPPVVVAPAPPAPPPVAQAPASTWYYCDAAQAYYPYVAECPGGWRAVPATPPR